MLTVHRMLLHYCISSVRCCGYYSRQHLIKKIPSGQYSGVVVPESQLFPSFAPPVWQQLYLRSTAAKLNLNWEANKSLLHDIMHGNNCVELILLSNQWHKTHFLPTQDVSSLNRSFCSATSDTKHLYPAYSGCIRFKSIRPQVTI